MVSLCRAHKPPLCYLIVPRQWDRRCPVSWTHFLAIQAHLRAMAADHVWERWSKGMLADFGLLGAAPWRAFANPHAISGIGVWK